MEAVAEWWSARSGREQRLIQIAGALIFVIVLPAWIYLAAADFRADAAARLNSARQVERQVAQLTAASQAQANAPEGADVSLRGRVLAAAQAMNLSAARVEEAGADRVRIAFQPADSLSVYRWIEAVGAGGAYVSRTTILRIGDSEQVNAEFEVSASP